MSKQKESNLSGGVFGGRKLTKLQTIIIVSFGAMVLLTSASVAVLHSEDGRLTDSVFVNSQTIRFDVNSSHYTPTE